MASRVEITARRVRVTQLVAEGKNADDISRILDVSLLITKSDLTAMGIEIVRASAQKRQSKLKESASARLDDAVADTFGADFEGLGDRSKPTIVKLSEKFDNADSAAEALGVDVESMRLLAQQAKVDLMWHVVPDRRARIEESLRLFDSGMSVAHIAEHNGVSRPTAMKDLTLAGAKWNVDYTDDIRRLASQGLPAKEIATELGIAVGRVRNISKRADIEIARPKFKYETHGTIQCYNEGCRCDDCTEMNTKRHTSYIQSLTDREMPEELHGDIRGYLVWACRCDACKAVGSTNNKEVRDKRRKKLGIEPRAPRAWTTEEDRLIMDKSLRYDEICEAVGASRTVVYRRRVQLVKNGAEMHGGSRTNRKLTQSS